MNADFAKVKKLFFDRPKVRDAMDRKAAGALSRFGAFVRRRSKSSIKAAPKKEKTARKRGLIGEEGRYVSRPGDPPVSHVGGVGDNIYFGYDPAARSVVIGPVAFRGRGRGARALEQGGDSEDSRGRPVTIRARPFMRPAFLAELPQVPAEFRGGMQR